MSISTFQVGQRVAQLGDSVFPYMEVLGRRARAAGIDVINLNMGSPDLSPPARVTEALQEAIQAPDAFRYAMRDLPVFREGITGWYRKRYGVELDPDREVLGLLGSQDGLAHIAMALTDPGDIVLVPNPGYPIYASGATLCGAIPYPYELRPENNFAFDPESIPVEIWLRARLLFVNYPSNPLGVVAPPDLYKNLVEYAARYQVAVVHDAAYAEMTFDHRGFSSFLATPGAKEVGIEVGSFSKSFNMAGCRVGYAAGNPEIISHLARVKGHLDSGIFRPFQLAAVAAIQSADEWLVKHVRVYQERRDFVVNRLNQIGWMVPASSATMFLWAPTPSGTPSLAFAESVLERTGIIVTPGTGFGSVGEGYVRLALVEPVSRLTEAADRLAASGIFP